MLVPQFRCFSKTIQRFVQFPLFIIAQRFVRPFFNFWWICRQISVNICVECSPTPSTLSLETMLSASSHDRKSPRARTHHTFHTAHLGLSGTLTSVVVPRFHETVFLDEPNVFESLVCQLPQTVHNCHGSHLFQ